MVSSWKAVALLSQILFYISSASVTQIKDTKVSLSDFLSKNDAAIVEFFNPKGGSKSAAEDLEEASKLLDTSDICGTGRVAATPDILKEHNLEEPKVSVIHVMIKGKVYGDAFDGEREGSDTAASEIRDFARDKINEAKSEGKLKEKGEVEELKSSRQDRLCYKAEGVCVIYVANGQASQEEVSMLTKLKKKNTSKLQHGSSARGTTFNWSWLDGTKEPAFAAMVKGDPAELPGVVIFNPHKRPRYYSLDEGNTATEENIQNHLDNLQGGSARFTPAIGGKYPGFAKNSGKEESSDNKEEEQNDEL